MRKRILHTLSHKAEKANEIVAKLNLREHQNDYRILE
jgi:hypothetical protein